MDIIVKQDEKDQRIKALEEAIREVKAESRIEPDTLSEGWWSLDRIWNLVKDLV